MQMAIPDQKYQSSTMWLTSAHLLLIKQWIPQYIVVESSRGRTRRTKRNSWLVGINPLSGHLFSSTATTITANDKVQEMRKSSGLEKTSSNNHNGYTVTNKSDRCCCCFSERKTLDPYFPPIFCGILAGKFKFKSPEVSWSTWFINANSAGLPFSLRRFLTCRFFNPFDFVNVASFETKRESSNLQKVVMQCFAEEELQRLAVKN